MAFALKPTPYRLSDEEKGAVPAVITAAKREAEEAERAARAQQARNQNDAASAAASAALFATCRCSAELLLLPSRRFFVTTCSIATSFGAGSCAKLFDATREFCGR